MSQLLKRNFETHSALAIVMLEGFIRLYQRDLLDEEIDTIKSYTLCDSFMSIESTCHGLHFSTTLQQADEHFSFIKSTVLKNSDLVVREVQKTLRLKSNSPQPADFSNLLAWEEALLNSFKSGL